MSVLGALRGDVLVIGGGPAGLAAAIALRLRGFDVALADARHPPIDKTCGEGILPSGVEALRRLGVALESSDGYAFRGIRFVEDGRSVEAAFSSACGIGVRRTRLHELLASRAEAAGVRLLWGSSISGLAGLRSFRWIVGADGLHSRVRQEAELAAAHQLSVRFGFRRHYAIAPWTDVVEVHWSEHCQVYVTPVSHREVGVALLTRDPHLRLDSALAALPALNRRLRNAPQASVEGGASTTTTRLRRVYREHVILIGDASGSVDAITGEGLSLAFQQALSLADALAAEDPRLYQIRHRRLARGPAAMAALLLLLDRFPLLRRAVWRTLAVQPALFGRVLTRYALGASPK